MQFDKHWLGWIVQSLPHVVLHDGKKKLSLKESSKEMETCFYKRTITVVPKKSALGDFW